MFSFLVVQLPSDMVIMRLGRLRKEAATTKVIIELLEMSLEFFSVLGQG
jgi:hypothetical protein